MSIRSELNGAFAAEDLDRLTWPIAWQGVVSPVERHQEEYLLAELVNDAREQLAAAGGSAVEIARGEIVAVLVED